MAAANEAMTKKLIVGSLKGGVGKTTVAVNLACALADGTRTVVLVDLDAQGTATEWLEAGHLPITGQGLPLENTGGVRRWVESEQGVKRLVEQVLSVDADLGIIDLPPHLSAIAAAALTLADLVIIPCGASVADVSATAKTLDLVRRARAIRGGDPPVILVPSRVDWRTSAGRAIEGALAEFGELVGPGIGQRIVFADSLGVGEWVGQYAPGSAAHSEIEVLAAFVSEVLGDKPPLARPKSRRSRPRA
ncbi:MAG: ParA family protein [Proteobacteria bacterium]|nr:ParA family protein [Pseudomonadota bacterium]